MPGNTSILSSGLAEEVSVARSIAVNASTGAERAMKAVRMAQAAVDEVRATVEGSKESDTIANIAKEVDNLNQTLMEQLVELSERVDELRSAVNAGSDTDQAEPSPPPVDASEVKDLRDEIAEVSRGRENILW